MSDNKFVVLLKKSKPARVWTGSANFSGNAFYFQTNTALIIDDRHVAESYETYFQVLAGDPERVRSANDPNGARQQVAAAMAAANQRTELVDRTYFSPLRSRDIVEAAIDMVGGAKSCIFISSPFGLDKEIVAAIEKNPAHILEYGLATATARKRVEALNRRNTRFFTPTRLETYLGRAWDAKAFGAHKIHAKTIVVDPWGPAPKLLIGSANFSDGSCRENDENALLIENNPGISAIIASEFIRMFDHYKSRAFINQFHQAGVSDVRYLREDGSWSATAFKARSRSYKFQDRLVFSGN